MTSKYGNLSRRFIFDQSGSTAIEYAITVILISAAIIPVINGLGSALTAKLAFAAGATFSVIAPLGP